MSDARLRCLERDADDPERLARARERAGLWDVARVAADPRVGDALETRYGDGPWIRYEVVAVMLSNGGRTVVYRSPHVPLGASGRYLGNSLTDLRASRWRAFWRGRRSARVVARGRV